VSALDKVMPAWVITDSGFVDYACKDHAREFALERGIPENDGYDGYSLTREGYGIIADVYPVQSWDGYEADYPASCQCGQYLGGVALTRDGYDYMLDNEFPAWLYVAHNVTIDNEKRS
jgi:hypothetical protein